MYRRNRGNGTWVVKVKASDSDGAYYWTQRFAEADDYDNADNLRILDFFNAQDMAKQLAGAEDSDAAPITVDGALKDYEHDLVSRKARTSNATWPRLHLTPTLLAKPVALLTSKELKTWRDSLLAVIAPATVNRVCNCICAALELAAQHDKRIQNKDAWEVGLAGLPAAQEARNVVLSDDKVRAFVAEAYRRDAKLGLLMDVLAVTGARPSQAIRLHVDDLQYEDNDPARPKLLMPRSGKGGGRNRADKKVKRYSVPITMALAERLRQDSQGRNSKLLLIQSDSTPWPSDPSLSYRRPVRDIVAALELDPDEVTTYSLRHSSIVRMLLVNVPIRLVASLHDTSVQMIESNYSRYITEYTDAHTRAALLQPEAC
jgi:integrase